MYMQDSKKTDAFHIKISLEILAAVSQFRCVHTCVRLMRKCSNQYDRDFDEVTLLRSKK